MGLRPLNERERAYLEQMLLEVKKRHAVDSAIIIDIETQLQKGVWDGGSPDEFRKMWAEVGEKARKWREQAEQREIEEYGHILTQAEHMGWTTPPKRLVKAE